MSENEQDSISDELSLEQKDKDKSLYAVGDKTFSGYKINRIYYARSNYIIFQREGGGLAYEANMPVSLFLNKSLTEHNRLSGLSLNLGKKHKATIQSLLASSLDSVFSTPTQDESNITALFKNISEYIEKYQDEYKSIISSSENFSIYLTKDDTIEYFHKNLPSYLEPVVEEFNNLQALSTSILPKSHRAEISRILASSLEIAFRKENANDVKNVFDNTKKFILSQVCARLKVRIFAASLISSIVFSFILFGIYKLFDLNIIFTSGMIAGVLGSMISTLQRNNTTLIDPYNNSLLGFSLYTESISRLIMGAIFGLFVVFCIKAELALASFKDNIYAIACFSFIAGFSERFVPDLMSSITKNNDIDNTKT